MFGTVPVCFAGYKSSRFLLPERRIIWPGIRFINGSVVLGKYHIQTVLRGITFRLAVLEIKYWYYTWRIIMERIIVYELLGNLAVSNNDGEILHTEIEKALVSGSRVIVDFNGVDVVIAQFLNAAIAALYENHGSEELKEKLVITGLKSTDSLRKVIARAKSFYVNEKGKKL